ncbi:hypothetical protein NEAUS06_1951 [Nematocida ausubeli]|nr:hypothetical protein NEAUS06_1951 [Nematocida ausubeli]
MSCSPKDNGHCVPLYDEFQKGDDIWVFFLANNPIACSVLIVCGFLSSLYMIFCIIESCAMGHKFKESTSKDSLKSKLIRCLAQQKKKKKEEAKKPVRLINYTGLKSTAKPEEVQPLLQEEAQPLLQEEAQPLLQEETQSSLQEEDIQRNRAATTPPLSPIEENAYLEEVDSKNIERRRSMTVPVVWISAPPQSDLFNSDRIIEDTSSSQSNASEHDDTPNEISPVIDRSNEVNLRVQREDSTSVALEFNSNQEIEMIELPRKPVIPNYDFNEVEIQAIADEHQKLQEVDILIYRMIYKISPFWNLVIHRVGMNCILIVFFIWSYYILPVWLISKEIYVERNDGAYIPETALDLFFQERMKARLDLDEARTKEISTRELVKKMKSFREKSETYEIFRHIIRNKIKEPVPLVKSVEWLKQNFPDITRYDNVYERIMARIQNFKKIFPGHKIPDGFDAFTK